MFDLMMMMMMVIIVPIIIIMIIGMSMPNTQSRPKTAGGNHCKKTRTHAMPQGGRGKTTPSRPTTGPNHTTGRWEATHHHTTPHHTTPQGGGWRGGTIGGWRGGSAEPGSYIKKIFLYIYIYMRPYVCRGHQILLRPRHSCDQHHCHS